MPFSKPTLLLAHGSFHPPKAYAGFCENLEKRGFEVHCPALPTADPKYLVADPSNPSFDQPPPPGGLPSNAQDAAVLRAVLETLIENEGKDVLVLAHSSGAWSSSEAAVPQLHRERRAKEGKTGGLIGMFNMVTYLPVLGQTLVELFIQSLEGADMNNTAFQAVPDRNLSVIANPPYWILHDVEGAEADKVEKMLTACPPLMSKLTNEPYGTLPCAYLFCEGDRVVLPWFQWKTVKTVEEKCGVKFDVFKCDGGHDSFLSQADVWADSIEKFVEKCA